MQAQKKFISTRMNWKRLIAVSVLLVLLSSKAYAEPRFWNHCEDNYYISGVKKRVRIAPPWGTRIASLQGRIVTSDNVRVIKVTDDIYNKRTEYNPENGMFITYAYNKGRIICGHLLIDVGITDNEIGWIGIIEGLAASPECERVDISEIKIKLDRAEKVEYNISRGDEL